MKKCELCESLATIYCESDRASLCCDCDSKVHSANFLVAKHSRTLLCHVCQSFTPWIGSGPKLGLTVSVCQNCSNSDQDEGLRDDHVEGDEMDDDEGDEMDDGEGDENNSDEDDDDDDDDGGDGCEDEDEDNQVVPWSSTTLPPPPVSSSSASNESSSSFYFTRERVFNRR